MREALEARRPPASREHHEDFEPVPHLNVPLGRPCKRVDDKRDHVWECQVFGVRAARWGELVLEVYLGIKSAACSRVACTSCRALGGYWRRQEPTFTGIQEQ